MTGALRASRTALIAGAGGLVGGQLLRLLLDEPDYAGVVSIGRRRLDVSHPKLAQTLVDFERLDPVRDALRGDDLFCCLGTTRRQAGSAAAFRRFDFDAVFSLVRVAFANGVGRLFLVSAMGANPRSSFLYPRVKGELEQAVAALPFRGVTILRPSLLLGARAKRRPLELLARYAARLLSFAFVGPLRPYRPIEAAAVARAMLAAARRPPRGVEVLGSDRIQALADE